MPLSIALKRPKQSLNKSYLRNAQVDRETFEHFKVKLRRLLEATAQNVSQNKDEENIKAYLRDFFNDTFYKDKYHINTKDRTDLVIHADSSSQSPVNVLFETKKPSNTVGMISKDQPNAKAMQQLVLYYLRERENEQNTDIKYLIITNVYAFFIFEAAEFEKLFYQNKAFLGAFRAWQKDKKTQDTTKFFYESIAQPFIENLNAEITATYFTIKDYEQALKAGESEEEEKLLALYLLLSPEHLLKTYTYDSNQLNQRFYEELLHIIGLEEVKEKGKKLIKRKKEKDRDYGSLLENTLAILETSQRIDLLPNPKRYGETQAEQLYNISLELVITWVNRILFLKLLEGQLIKFHRGDTRFRFLDQKTLTDFDDLYELFFEVLAKLPDERRAHIQSKYENIPYLNSSLFGNTELEKRMGSINTLNNSVGMRYFPQTVLVDGQNKPETGKTLAFEYLLRFLDAYDFSAEGQEKIQEHKKELINASVLGLIFEKLNGYKDGSFYTPGFITMYMARETLRKTVLDKFNQQYAWNCPTFDRLPAYLEVPKLQEYNALINSIKVCDPAVGSGHFLVSVLNEFLALKSDLGVLLDTQGRKIVYYSVTIYDDELVITDYNNDPFEYTVGYKNGRRKTGKEKQRIQEAIFHEKRHVIENCLFGVDINPNSVTICRLRLWIELLKHTFYKAETDFQELEVLPNLDMKILEGNSLIPTLRQDPFFIDWEKGKLQSVGSTQKHIEAINESVETIRKNTQVLFNLQDVREKNRRVREIEDAKIEIAKAYYSIEIFKTQSELHTLDPKGRIDNTLSKKEEKRKAELEAQLQTLKNNHFEMQVALYYTQTIALFDWKIMFSEVLGTFKNGGNGEHGFDIVIGNPPYIRQEDIKPFKPYLENRFDTYAGTADLFVYFIELGIQKLLAENGSFSYIVPNKWMRAGYGKALREFVKKHAIQEIIDFGDLRVFEKATTYPSILSMKKSTPQTSFQAANVDTLDFPKDMANYLAGRKIEVLTEELSESGWTLTDSKAQQLLAKLRQKGMPLDEYVEDKIFYGIKTGYDEAFRIDKETRDRLIAEDPKSAEVIKPFLIGSNISSYQQPKISHFLVLFKSGATKSWFGELSETQAWEKLSEKFPAVCAYLLPYKKQSKARYDQGQYWWELRPCGYYEEFEKEKIVWAETSKDNQLCIVEAGVYLNKTTFMIPASDYNLLGILNSNLVRFFLDATVSKVRGGYFSMSKSYVSQVPILATDRLAPLVSQILTLKKADPETDTSTLEAQIDQLVYQLYGLTEEEIEIVDYRCCSRSF